MTRDRHECTTLVSEQVSKSSGKLPNSADDLALDIPDVAALFVPPAVVDVILPLAS